MTNKFDTPTGTTLSRADFVSHPAKTALFPRAIGIPLVQQYNYLNINWLVNYKHTTPLNLLRKIFIITIQLLLFNIALGQNTIKLLTSSELEKQKIYVSVEDALKDYNKGIPVYRLYLANKGYQKLPVDILKINTLQELQLPWNSLTGLPPEIKNLKYLQTLNLVWNFFPKFPIEICSLKSLRFLNIPGRGKKKIPTCLTKLSHIKHLILTGYNFKEFPKILTKLNSLEILVLNNCNIKYLPDALFYLPNLKKLYLRNNKLKKIPPSLEKAINLQYIDLRGNRLPHKLNKVFLSKTEIKNLINYLKTN